MSRESNHVLAMAARSMGGSNMYTGVAAEREVSRARTTRAMQRAAAPAGVEPFEISLTGDLEEVGSQRQLLTDDDLFQFDCGGTQRSEESEGWLW